MNELWHGLTNWFGWICVATFVLAEVGLWGLLHRGKIKRARLRDGRSSEELEAYARLELQGTDANFGEKMCKVVAEVSAFPQVAILRRNEQGRLLVTAQMGMQEMEAPLNEWGEKATFAAPRPSPGMGAEKGSGAVWRESCAVTKEPALRPWTRRAWIQCNGKEVWLLPLWTAEGRMSGALAVHREGEVQERDLGSLEWLAATLGTTLENAALTKQPLELEKLAAL